MINADVLDALLARMFRPHERGMRTGVDRAARPLVDAGVFEGLHQLDQDTWSTERQPPDWSRTGDVSLLDRWHLGYAFNAAVPALEIRTPQVLLRHVGRRHGADALRAHLTAAEPPVDPELGRVVVVSRRQRSAAGVLDRPLPPPSAEVWLDRHSDVAWPLGTIKGRLKGFAFEVSPTEWLTHYDGPGRLVTITRGQAEHRIVPLEPIPELAHEHLRGLRAAGSSRGTLVRLEVSLDSAGQPLAWPSRLDAGLLGSPTAWPDPNRRYGWWHRVEPNVNGRPGFGADASRLGPVLDRPSDADAHWPLFGREQPAPAPPPRRRVEWPAVRESRPVPHSVERAAALPAGARRLLGGEGGSVHLLEKSGQYLVVTAEFALAHESGVPPCTVYRFDSEEDRLAYLEHRGWSR